MRHSVMECSRICEAVADPNLLPTSWRSGAANGFTTVNITRKWVRPSACRSKSVDILQGVSVAAEVKSMDRHGFHRILGQFVVFAADVRAPRFSSESAGLLGLYGTSTDTSKWLIIG
jgi:hypothetical protein